MPMKKRILITAFAALFILTSFCGTAFASELETDSLDVLEVIETAIAISNDSTVPNEAPEAIEIDADNLDTQMDTHNYDEPTAPITDYPKTPPKPFTPFDMSEVMATVIMADEDTTISSESPEVAEIDADNLDEPDAPITDYPETPPKPFTPSGMGTVIDNVTEADGKEFYTITTPDESVFYLIVDRQRGTDNVYFLNAVTIADLMALAEIPELPQSATGTRIPQDSTPESLTDALPIQTEVPAETPPAPEQEQRNGTMGMIIIITLIIVVGGGTGWYFKIYRPKQQAAASGEEYEEHVDETDSDYSDWDEEQDTIDNNPPWDDEIEDSSDNPTAAADNPDDNPPWDVDDDIDDNEDGQ